MKERQNVSVFFFFLLFWHVSRCCTCLEKISLGPFVQTSSTQPKMKKNWSVKTREKFFCLEVFRSTTRLNGGENYISVQTDPSFLFPETERERESYLYVRKKNGRREREREGSRPCQSKQGLEADFLFCFPSSFLIFRLRVAAMLAWQNRRRTDQEKPL